jgi:2,4-dienoyl-CoA reductase-like NADH-dependent reductase (Old Yellow Enzyme family)
MAALRKEQPSGTTVPYTAPIKRAVGVPVVAVGKLGEAGMAARLIAEGAADLAAIGRQLIVDPDAAGKLLDGRADDTIRCAECMGCFASVSRNYGPLRCTVNRNPAGAPVYAPRDVE